MTPRANRTPRVVATRPGLLTRLHRALIQLHVRLLRWEADGIRAEREQYEEIGAIGATYLFNSYSAQLQLLIRARRLEQRL